MDGTSPIVGEIVGDDDDNRTAEEFLALMTNDPTLAANTVSDVLEATAEAFADPNFEFSAKIIDDVVNELDPRTRVFLETLTDAARRRQAFQERLPFIDWIANGQSSGVDSLSAKLLDAADRADWPEPVTYSDYREYLAGLPVSGEITSEDVEYFQSVLWPQYVAAGLATVGDECSTTQEWQYSVEMHWEDSFPELHEDTRYGTSRMHAERVYRAMDCHQTSGRPVLQRRLSVHGPWVNVP